MRILKLKSTIFAVILLAALISSCANNDLGPLKTIECGNDAVSYADDIVPIINVNCARAGCHNANDFPGRDWQNPDLLQDHAEEAARRVQLPTSDPDHMPMDPPELTDEQIRTIVCWARNGAPINN